MKRRFASLVLLATLAVGALTACGGGTGGTQASPADSGGGTGGTTGGETEATSTATP